MTADTLLIGRWCREQSPAEMLDQVRVECEIADRHVTINETRPPWDGRGDWIAEHVARLRYTASTGVWTLYWCDRNSSFHLYTPTPPTKNVQALLEHIAESGDPIFWG